MAPVGGKQFTGRPTGAKKKNVPVEALKRKAASQDVEGDEGADEGTKTKKPLTAKRKRRLEVTHLYGELINPGRERKPEEIVSDLLEVLKVRADKLCEYCSKEVGSRVVQACLKWGTRDQRRHIMTSLKDDIIFLATNRFGHVVFLKLLHYCAKTSTGRKPSEDEKKAQAANLKLLLDPFQGKELRKTFYHRFGCKVINGIYFNELVPSRRKRIMFHEVAIPQEVALLNPNMPGSKPLRELLCSPDLTAAHKSSMMLHLQEANERAVDKELLALDIVHIMYQAYCEHATESQLKELAEKCFDGAPYLVSSKPGADAVVRLLGVASAKQRKSFMKDMKGKFPALAMNSVDYLVVLRLLTTVDDTVLLSKTVLAELGAAVKDMCYDKHGKKVLTWLFCPSDKQLFSPFERESLELPAPASIKAPEKRREEVVRVLRPHVRKVLLESPLMVASDSEAKDVLVAYLRSGWDLEVVASLVIACENARKASDFGGLDDGTLTTTLLAILRLPHPEVATDLAEPLWRKVLEPRFAEAACTRLSFVALAIFKRQDPVSKEVATAIKGCSALVATQAKDAEKAGKKMTGARQLLEACGAAGAGSAPKASHGGGKASKRKR